MQIFWCLVYQWLSLNYTIIFSIVHRLQWKTREQQKALENELATREEFENELESLKSSLERARDELQRLEDDDSIDLETKLARQQVRFTMHSFMKYPTQLVC